MDNNFEPLKNGWFKPRETARYLIDHASTKYIVFLFIIITIAMVTLSGGYDGYVDVNNLWIYFIVLVVLSPLVGAAIFGLYSFYLWIIGKSLKGQGIFKDLFKALIGANIPMLFTVPFMLTWAVLEPRTYLNGDISTFSIIEIILNVSAFSLIEIISTFMLFISSIWSLASMIIAISEAHRFSTGKALFTILLPAIVLFALFVLMYIFVV